ncbi:MAG TPA: PQQ-dependent sugar dehydrogenase [Solirubrobacteraceae bacterium]
MVRPAALAAAVLVCALGACGGSSDDAPARSDRAAPHATTAPPGARPAQRRAGRLRLVSIGRFDSPLYVTSPPGDRRRVFVVEQGGTIHVVRGGRKLAEPFLDIHDKVVSGGEQGLLSMAFAPDYARSGRFYVDYTDTNGDSRIVEYRRATADRADPGSARQVLFQPQPEANHNGGLVLFGPDRLLYIGFGDGGGGNDQHGPRGNAQSLGTWLGKILRIDPRAGGGKPYRVPSSNPFVGRAGAKPEIYAYGLRNPWRFSFDRRTGDLSIGDVGQDEREEVDFARRGRAKGANFGWRPFEGNRRNFDEPAPGARRPAFDYGRAGGNCSVTGGVVVRDRGVPSLYGRYVYGDYCAGRLLAATLRANGARNRRALPLRTIPELSSFGEDALGRVYATSLAGGVWRFAQ